MIGLDVRMEMVGGYAVADIEGEIDMANVESLRSTLLRGLSNAAAGAVLDFSRTGYIDSAGINLLFHLSERMRARGQVLRLVVPDGSPIGDALRYAGVLQELDISSSREAALGG